MPKRVFSDFFFFNCLWWWLAENLEIWEEEKKTFSDLVNFSYLLLKMSINQDRVDCAAVMNNPQIAEV